MNIQDYIHSTFLAQDIEKNLLAQFNMMQVNKKIIVDMGCNVGRMTQALQKSFPETIFLGLDPNKSRLDYAKKHSVNAIHWLQSDTLRLPFQDQSIDAIISNLFLAWQPNVEKIFAEWRRILKPNGLLLFSTLGPDSLREISEHNLHLIDLHDLGDSLLKLGFEDPVLEVEIVSVNYKDVTKMQQELINSDMIAPLATEMIPSQMTLTYEVICAHAWRPRQTSFSPDDTGTVKIPLAYLRQRNHRQK